MRSAMILRTPFNGVSAKPPGNAVSTAAAAEEAAATAAGTGVVRSDVVTRPPRPVPEAADAKLSAVAAAPRVSAGPASNVARTSRSMTRPWGPVPAATAERGSPDAEAKPLARGLAADAVTGAATAVAGAGVAAAGAGAGVSGAGAAPSERGSAPLKPASARASATDSPGAPMTAMGSLTGTSSPSSARRASTVPETPEGTSMVDLSVSISQSRLASSTVSPTATNQAVTRQDSTVLPSCGITTTRAICHQTFF